jgi:hypothetical protein
MRERNPFMVYCILNRINLITKNTCLAILPFHTINFFFFLFLIFWLKREFILIWHFIVLHTVLHEKSIFMIYSVNTCLPFYIRWMFCENYKEHKISATNSLFLLPSLVSLKAPLLLQKNRQLFPSVILLTSSYLKY